MSNFPCSLTRNRTSHSMENLAFPSLLGCTIIILRILATSHRYIWENVLFFGRCQLSLFGFCCCCCCFIFTFCVYYGAFPFQFGPRSFWSRWTSTLQHILVKATSLWTQLLKVESRNQRYPWHQVNAYWWGGGGKVGRGRCGSDVPLYKLECQPKGSVLVLRP